MIHGIVGRRTVGKTTLADYLCTNARYQVRFSPRVTLPERGQHYGVYGADTGPGGADYGTLSVALEQGSCFTVVPDDDVDGTFKTFAHDVRLWCQRYETHIKTSREVFGMLVDEARFPAVRESRDLDWMFRHGDRALVHVYLTVHRPKDLHPDIRAIVDNWYVFHMTQPADLDVVHDECSPLVAKEASKLRPREFIKFDVGEQRAYHWKQHEASEWQPRSQPLTREQIRNPGDMFKKSDDTFELL